VEIETVRALADAGALVVCGGGGGVPVVRSDSGELTGVEAVVDKDLTAAELAITLKADRLLVLTDVPAVFRDYGTPAAEPLRAIDVSGLSAMTFPAGSMGPKVEACIRFVKASGQPAAIGALTEAADVLAGRAGTTISCSATRLLVPRIIFLVEVFEADRADRRHLGDVLTGFCPVEVRGAGGQDDDGTRRVRLQFPLVELFAHADVEHTGHDRVDPVFVMPVRHQLDAGWQLDPDHVRSWLRRVANYDGQTSRRRERRERLPVDTLRQNRTENRLV
jgi:hypothetical protein